MSIQKTQRKKTRRCRTCRKKAEGEGAIITPVQAFCSYECAKEYLKSSQAKKDQMKRDRAILRDFRERDKKISQWHKEAQRSFNTYIRTRDAKKMFCVSCAAAITTVSIGGRADAGHFRSIGSASHMRYNNKNVHYPQCRKCNNCLSGNYPAYRKSLLLRFGEQFVDDLENDQRVVKYTVEYLKRIKKIFNKKTRLYKKLFR